MIFVRKIVTFQYVSVSIKHVSLYLNQMHKIKHDKSVNTLSRSNIKANMKAETISSLVNEKENLISSMTK